MKIFQDLEQKLSKLEGVSRNGKKAGKGKSKKKMKMPC